MTVKEHYVIKLLWYELSVVFFWLGVLLAYIVCGDKK